MIKPAAFTGAIILAVIAFGLFEIEYKVDSLRTQLTEINRDLVADKEEIHVLKAEWSYLSQPERVKVMSEKYLSLGTIGASQIADISEVRNIDKEYADGEENIKNVKATRYSSKE